MGKQCFHGTIGKEKIRESSPGEQDHLFQTVSTPYISDFTNVDIWIFHDIKQSRALYAFTSSLCDNPVNWQNTTVSLLWFPSAFTQHIKDPESIQILIKYLLFVICLNRYTNVVLTLKRSEFNQVGKDVYDKIN